MNSDSTIRMIRTLFNPFICNICGCKNITRLKFLNREQPSCRCCGSKVRMRALINLLSTTLFHQSLIIQDFPINKDIRVIGLSDWEEYAQRLQNKLNYTNTFFHHEPKLDIMNIQENDFLSLDVLMSSDVFEHVLPPIEKAFNNAFDLLKPDGTLLLTVPYTLDETTVEHFPELHKFDIFTDKNGVKIIRNQTRDGQTQIYNNLIFHGGEGETLEMRIFSKAGLIKILKDAGFVKIKFHEEPVYKYGIVWKQPWSLPITAKKPTHD
jgi:SAM-dependent methyltransferase